MTSCPLVLNFNRTSNMNIDYSELERGFAEEMQKAGGWNGFMNPLNTGDGTGAWNKSKSAFNTFTAPFRGTFNFGSGALQTAHKGLSVLADGPSAISGAMNKLPGIIDNVGKFAPLAMGAMMLPSLMGKGQGQQGGAGQPIVVNNYMGQKPNILTPQQGVHSLSDPMPKMSEFQEKKADIITKALADAAKRRMANKVLDVVTPEEDIEERRSPEELEVVTKYPEMAKMLEDEQNKAYLSRLLQH